MTYVIYCHYTTISNLSLNCHFLLCHKFPPLFPNHAFRNTHFSRVRAFRQGKPPLYFVACYYAQYRMRSAIMRNHLNQSEWRIVFMYIISVVIQLPGKIPKSDWLREVVFQLNRYFKFLMKSSVIFDIYLLV